MTTIGRLSLKEKNTWINVFKTHVYTFIQKNIQLQFSNIQNIPGLLFTTEENIILDAIQRNSIAQAYYMTAEYLNTRQFSDW